MFFNIETRDYIIDHCKELTFFNDKGDFIEFGTLFDIVHYTKRYFVILGKHHLLFNEWDEMESFVSTYKFLEENKIQIGG